MVLVALSGFDGCGSTGLRRRRSGKGSPQIGAYRRSKLIHPDGARRPPNVRSVAAVAPLMKKD